MKYKAVSVFLLCLTGLFISRMGIADAVDHTGAPGVGDQRPAADPSAYTARLNALISACTNDRNGHAAGFASVLGNLGGGNTLGAAANAVNGGGSPTDGATLYMSRCFGCHGVKSPQASIACIQGNCNATVNGRKASVMPPTGALPAAEQSAIVGYLNSISAPSL